MAHQPLVTNQLRLEQTTRLFKSIAHPIRLQIVLALAQRPMKEATLQKQLAVEQGLLAQHLLQLTNLGILASQERGKDVYYRIANPSLIELVQSLLTQIG